MSALAVSAWLKLNAPIAVCGQILSGPGVGVNVGVGVSVDVAVLVCVGVFVNVAVLVGVAVLIVGIEV